MANIVKILNSIDGFRSLGEISDELIRNAETELEIKFSNDYYNYLKKFGVGTFADVELTGIVKSTRLNVVAVTKSNRESYPHFPKDMYVIHCTNFEGIDILQNSKGEVYRFDPVGKNKLICSSLNEYILSLTT